MKTQPTQDFVKECLTNLAVGVAVGIQDFIKANHINTDPGHKCKEPTKVFVDLIMSEWGDKGEEHYPFEASAKEVITEAYRQSLPVLIELVNAGENANAMALCRVIGRGEMAKFLDENRIDAVSLFNTIRG